MIAQSLTPSLAALCGLAFLLGLRHGFDVDHLATIDGIVRRNLAVGARNARLSGIWFSLGHGVVVLTTAAAVSLSAAKWQVPGWLETSGTLISAIFLAGLAVLNFHALWSHAPGHAAVPVGLRSRLLSRAKGQISPLATLGIGVLFALSFDTLSQAALFAFLAARLGGIGETLLAATCFTVGMAATDGANGMWVASLIGRADARARHASRIMTAAVAALSLVLSGAIFSTLLSPGTGHWADAHGVLLSVLLITGVVAAFVAAMAFARPERPVADPAEDRAI